MITLFITLALNLATPSNFQPALHTKTEFYDLTNKRK